jgi:hypothetical protein
VGSRGRRVPFGHPGSAVRYFGGLAGVRRRKPASEPLPITTTDRGCDARKCPPNGDSRGIPDPLHSADARKLWRPDGGARGRGVPTAVADVIEPALEEGVARLKGRAWAASWPYYPAPRIRLAENHQRIATRA